MCIVLHPRKLQTKSSCDNGSFMVFKVFGFKVYGFRVLGFRVFRVCGFWMASIIEFMLCGVYHCVYVVASIIEFMLDGVYHCASSASQMQPLVSRPIRLPTSMTDRRYKKLRLTCS